VNLESRSAAKTKSWTVSERMAAVRQKNTRPEIALATELAKLRRVMRRHDASLPGTPDIIFPRARLAVFVHGCFWHRHCGCRRATSPRSNAAFWAAKFQANVRRDDRKARKLRTVGWSVFVVWECQIEKDPSRQARRISAALRRRGAVHDKSARPTSRARA